MKYLLIIVVSFLLLSCGNSNKETTAAATDETKTDSAETVVIPEATETSRFELDWKNFKIAMKDRDAAAVESYMDTDAITAEELMDVFSEYNYRVELEGKEYYMLDESSWNDKTVKEFRADTEFTDEEGNTYESAIFLYFEEQERGLKLVNFMAAG